MGLWCEASIDCKRGNIIPIFKSKTKNNEKLQDSLPSVTGKVLEQIHQESLVMKQYIPQCSKKQQAQKTLNYVSICIFWIIKMAQRELRRCWHKEIINERQSCSTSLIELYTTISVYVFIHSLSQIERLYNLFK